MSSVQDSTIIPWDTLNTFSALLLWFLCAFAYNDQHLWLPSKDSPGLLEPLFLPRQLKAPESWLPLCPSQGNFRWGLMESVKVQLLLQKCWGIICTKELPRDQAGAKILPKSYLCLASSPSQLCFLHSFTVFSQQYNKLFANESLSQSLSRKPDQKQATNEFIHSFIYCT